MCYHSSGFCCRQAAKLLLDCIATFTCVELCSYKTFMLYALLTNLICLDRNQLRKKLVQDPHVITAVRELPAARRLLHGIFHCDYQQFFSAVGWDATHVPGSLDVCVYTVCMYAVCMYI